jgi:hypothetical protein
MNLIRSGRGPHAWFLLNFALWWKEFVENKSAYEQNHAGGLVATP